MYIYIFIFAIIIYFFISERMIESRHNICDGCTDLSKNGWSKLYRIIFFNIILILIFISTFRANHIGSDHGNYINTFNSIQRHGDTYFREKGFVLLNKIAILIDGNMTTVCFLVSSMLCMSYCIYITKYVRADYYIFSLIIFAFQPYMYIQSTFNIMRQGCATAVVLFSIPFLIDKKWIHFVIFILLASSFHTSALFMLLLIIFCRVNVTTSKLRLFAMICFVINILNVGKLLVRLIRIYANYSSYESSMLNFKPYVIAIFVIILYFTKIYSKLYDNEKEKFFVDIFLISLSLLMLCLQNDMMYRVYIYFAFISVPGITVICKNLKKRIIELCFTGYYSAFYIGYISLWYINNDAKYYPFKFIFEV